MGTTGPLAMRVFLLVAIGAFQTRLRSSSHCLKEICTVPWILFWGTRFHSFLHKLHKDGAAWCRTHTEVRRMGDLRAGGPWLITSVSNLRAELPGQICRLVHHACYYRGTGGWEFGNQIPIKSSNSPVKQVLLLFPYYRWENQGSKRWRDLPQDKTICAMFCLNERCQYAWKQKGAAVTTGFGNSPAQLLLCFAFQISGPVSLWSS